MNYYNLENRKILGGILVVISLVIFFSIIGGNNNIASNQIKNDNQFRSELKNCLEKVDEIYNTAKLMRPSIYEQYNFSKKEKDEYVRIMEELRQKDVGQCYE